MKVFLGGTCNESTWRKDMILLLDKMGVEYFNPVVDDWTEDCMVKEIRERKECDFVLYTITPKMTGVYSIAEVVDDSNKRPERTIFILLKEDENYHFDEMKWRSLNAVTRMVKANGGQVFNDLESGAIWIRRR